MNTESQIQKLEREIEEMKVSFAQSASTMKTSTTTMSFQTLANLCTRDGSAVHGPDEQSWTRVTSEMYYHEQGSDVYYCTECVEVTFNSNNGTNVLATLEINVLNVEYPSVRTTRIPYNGGAKWILHIDPNVTSHSSGGNRYWTWEPTNLQIAVQSNTAGILGAKMIWQ